MKKLFTILSILFIFPVWATGAYALGLGMYIPLGAGESDHTIDRDFVFDTEFEDDSSYNGFGFVLDTNVAGKSTFNYRLNVGFENGEYDLDTNFGNNSRSVDYERIVADNTFGFGVVKTENVRLWVGPQIRVAYLHIDEARRWGQNEELNALGIGLGPAIGVNFHLGPTVSLGIDSGYRITKYYGSFDANDNNEHDDDDPEYDSDDREVYVNFSIIFRIDDMYN